MTGGYENVWTSKIGGGGEKNRLFIDQIETRSLTKIGVQAKKLCIKVLTMMKYYFFKYLT